MDDIFVFLFPFSTSIKNKVVLFCYLGVVKVADLPLIIAGETATLFCFGSLRWRAVYLHKEENLSFCSFVNTNAV